MKPKLQSPTCDAHKSPNKKPAKSISKPETSPHGIDTHEALTHKRSWCIRWMSVFIVATSEHNQRYAQCARIDTDRPFIFPNIRCCNSTSRSCVWIVWVSRVRVCLSFACCIFSDQGDGCVCVRLWPFRSRQSEINVNYERCVCVSEPQWKEE